MKKIDLLFLMFALLVIALFIAVLYDTGFLEDRQYTSRTFYERNYLDF